MTVSFTPISQFDAVGDFTVTTPGVSDNGVWQYGWLPDLSDPASTFTMDDVISMTWAGVDGFLGHYSPEGNAIVLANKTHPPVTVVQGTATCPVGVLVSGPCGSGSEDGNYFGTLRFVAPVAGLYDVSGLFQGLDTHNTTVDVHVLQVTGSGSATASLFSGYVDGYYGGDADDPTGPTPVVPFSLPGLRLAQGDSLFFAIGDGGNGYLFDTTGLEVSVTVSAFGSIGPSGLADDPFGYLGGLGYWQDPGLSVSGLAGSAGSGLSYVRQRWLENGTGQWLSVDPVATEPRYGYAGNSPTMRVDPRGTQTGDVPKGDFQYLRSSNQPVLRGFESPEPRQREPLIFILEGLRSLANSAFIQEPMMRLADVTGNALQARIDQQVRRSRTFGVAGMVLVNEVVRQLLFFVPKELADFAPYSASELGEWSNGFVHGIAQGLYSLLPSAVVDSVIDFFEALVDNHFDLKAMLNAALVRFKQWVKSVVAGDLTARQCGEFVGAALISEVVLVFTIIDTIAAAAKVIDWGSNLIASTRFARAASASVRQASSSLRTFGEAVKPADPYVLGRVPSGSTIRALNAPESEIASGISSSAASKVHNHGATLDFGHAEAKADALLQKIAADPIGPPADAFERPFDEYSDALGGYEAQGTGDPTCAAASVAMILRHYGIEPDMDALNALAIEKKGLNALEIESLLIKYGVNAYGKRAKDYSELAADVAQGPVIAVIQRFGKNRVPHAVVVDKISVLNGIPVVGVKDPQGLGPGFGVFYQQRNVFYDDFARAGNVYVKPLRR